MDVAPGEPGKSRLAVSLRLKAARHLAGGISDGKVTAKSAKELSAHPLLHRNDITKNRLEDIEQMKVDARPMELEKIADALEVPRWFLLTGLDE